MSRAWGIFLIAVGLAGCQTSPTSRFAHSSFTRVPPPSTGSYRPGAEYYPQSRATSNTGQGSTMTGAAVSNLASNDGMNWTGRGRTDATTAPAITALPAATPIPTANGFVLSSPPVGTSVAPASFAEPVGMIQAKPADRPASTLRLRGMPLNDATSPGEPAPFVPPVRATEIGTLPPALQPATPRPNLSPGFSSVMPMSVPTNNLVRNDWVEVPAILVRPTGTPTVSTNSSGAGSSSTLPTNWKSKFQTPG